MLGLIIKDILIQKSYFLISILFGLVVVVPVLRNNPPWIILNYIWFLVWIIFSQNPFANDSLNRSEVIINSLPFSRKEIVYSRYLSSLAFSIFGLLIMLVWYGILKSFGMFDSIVIPWSSIISIGLILSALGTSIFYPIFFKVGFSKARWILFISFIIIFGSFFNMLSDGSKGQTPDLSNALLNYPTTVNLLAAGVTSTILIVISLMVSIWLYRTREF